MTPEIDEMTICLAVLLGIFFALLLGCALWMRISEFCEELQYVNMELQRCSAHQRPAWRRYRRRLWLWLFFLRRK